MSFQVKTATARLTDVSVEGLHASALSAPMDPVLTASPASELTEDVSVSSLTEA